MAKYKLGDKIGPTCTNVDNLPFVHLDGRPGEPPALDNTGAVEIEDGRYLTDQLQVHDTEVMKGKPAIGAPPLDLSPEYDDTITVCNSKYKLKGSPLSLALNIFEPTWIIYEVVDDTPRVWYRAQSSGEKTRIYGRLTCANIGDDIEIVGAPISDGGRDANGIQSIIGGIIGNWYVIDYDGDQDNVCKRPNPPFPDVPFGTNFSYSGDDLFCYSRDLPVNSALMYNSPRKYRLVHLNRNSNTITQIDCSLVIITRENTKQSFELWEEFSWDGLSKVYPSNSAGEFLDFNDNVVGVDNAPELL